MALQSAQGPPAGVPRPSKLRSILHDNGLSLVLVLLFLGMWAAQSVTGLHVENEERRETQRPPIPFAAYLQSGHFVEATAENWESEFLQMWLFVLLTAHLYQRGSAESRDPDAPKDEPEEVIADSPGPVKRGGWQRALYARSLSIALAAMFACSFVLHALGGRAMHSEERMAHGEPALTLLEYVSSSDFWFESFQNWQSEFLSVLAMVVLSIFLRHQGSPESKPVAAPHRRTGE